METAGSGCRCPTWTAGAAQAGDADAGAGCAVVAAGVDSVGSAPAFPSIYCKPKTVLGR